MNYTKIMKLPSENGKEIALNTVTYDKKKFFETINEISIDLGGKCLRQDLPLNLISGQSRVYTVRKQRLDLVRSTHTLFGYKPIYKKSKGIYEFYYNEDTIIKYFLNPVYQTTFRYHHYFRGIEMSESYPFCDEFTFKKIDEYLTKKNRIENSQYLEALKKYLQIFTITPTEERITEAMLVEKYQDSYHAAMAGQDEFNLQKDLAKSNQKILSLK